MSLEHWASVEELLALFGIDPSAPGADDFCTLVECSAAVLQYPALGCGTYAVSVGLMAERHWSPMIFWARMRRGCAALISADIETLRGLGLPIRLDVDKVTMYQIAHACASALAAAGAGGDYDYALSVARICERRKKK